MRFVDPDGRNPLAIIGAGALIGAGTYVVSQLAANDWSFQDLDINTTDLAAAAVGGAVAAGTIAAGFGALPAVVQANAIVGAAVGGIGNAIGGAVTAAMDSSPDSRAAALSQRLADFKTGALGGAFGVVASNVANEARGAAQTLSTRAGVRRASPSWNRNATLAGLNKRVENDTSIANAWGAVVSNGFQTMWQAVAAANPRRKHE